MKKDSITLHTELNSKHWALGGNSLAPLQLVTWARRSGGTRHNSGLQNFSSFDCTSPGYIFFFNLFFPLLNFTIPTTIPLPILSFFHSPRQSADSQNSAAEIDSIEMIRLSTREGGEIKEIPILPLLPR
ncbi:hypothetical protein C0Q70_04825 [Pomacea canaliculata]|uniref:Uncharacterized protein n=1 Tax=Pomacea canaliculata TaxID=400727 RepID=A0A2T7PJI2_POMCA|nr:hypothetical protein C0Q70_04825 [Pomacea canaliculata]